MKLKISLDDPEVRKTWESIEEAARIFAQWPAWKRGESLRSQLPAFPATSSTDARWGSGREVSRDAPPSA